MDDSHAELALELLRLFSFMHFEGISIDIFQRAGTNSELLEDFHGGSIFKETMVAKVMAGSWDPLLFRQALKLLIAFSLIPMDGTKGISMHPLVHEWSRDRMSATDQVRAWRATASILSMSIRFEYSSPHWQYRKYCFRTSTLV
jgi:hypothetical protein